MHHVCTFAQVCNHCKALTEISIMTGPYESVHAIEFHADGALSLVYRSAEQLYRCPNPQCRREATTLDAFKLVQADGLFHCDVCNSVMDAASREGAGSGGEHAQQRAKAEKLLVRLQRRASFISVISPVAIFAVLANASCYVLASRLWLVGMHISCAGQRGMSWSPMQHPASIQHLEVAVFKGLTQPCMCCFGKVPAGRKPVRPSACQSEQACNVWQVISHKPGASADTCQLYKC